jgi:hypothetical protein
MPPSIADTQPNNALHYAECHYADCRVLFIVMLSVVMLNVIFLSVESPTNLLTNLLR